MSRNVYLVLGISLLIALLFSWGLVPQFLTFGKMSSAAQEAQAPEADRKLVVCYGYADLEGGVTSLYPSQAGEVAEVLVKENDTVAAGAVLLRLDDQAARFRVAEARGLLDKARAELA